MALPTIRKRLERSYRGRRVLVTGAFGFLGGHMCRRLLECGADVTALDVFTRRARPSLLNEPSLGLRRRVRAVRMDMTDAAEVKYLLARRRFDVIFHFAAYAAVIEKAVQAPLATIDANTMAWVNLLDGLRVTRQCPNAVVLASTDKVYGDSGGCSYDEERTPLRGIGVYDAAKLAADLFSRMYHEVYSLPTVTVRMCNIFGPYDFNTGYRLIPRTLEGLFGEPMRPPQLYSDSRGHRRDYLYVDDAVRAFLLLAREPRCAGEVYNLKPCRNLSTARMLDLLLERAARIEAGSSRSRARSMRALGVRNASRPGDPSLVVIKKQHLGSSKIREAVGFRPEVSFERGLDRTIRFYRGYFRKRRQR